MNNTGNQKAMSDVSTLLVLRHRNNTVGMVTSLSVDGEVIDVTPENRDEGALMRIDASEHSFAEFYADFYHRLKDPEDYSFFKVKEFEAYETALGLQSYLAGSSADEKEDLKQYEVSIEAVESLRNEKNKMTDDGSERSRASEKRSAFGDRHSHYRYQVEDVNWGSMAEIGLDKAKLMELGALEYLFRGFKTPMLVPVLCDDEEDNCVDARLQLRLDDNGEVVVHVHRVQKRVDFRKKFMGHKFSKEDRMNLLNSGNMGRVVDLLNTMTGETFPSLVSLDKLTNELFSLRLEFVRIPEVICGVDLSAEQRKLIRSGKPLFVENMVSRQNTLFNATVQFNAERQCMDFFFNRKLKENGFEWCVPTTFRGVTLRRWQIEKLKAGEAAYIRGLISKKGKTYQGYIRFDKVVGIIKFSFKKMDK